MAILTAAECRKLAKAYQDQATELGVVDPRTATVLRNIASSFSGLASQFELLTAIKKEQPRQ
jgi:hypothetical protein